MKKRQRWYDKNPTVSLAVSLMKNSSENSKLDCANLIIAEAKNNNIEFPQGIVPKINAVFRRWYDEEKSLSDAMEYLRLSPESLRKTIALELIKILEQAEIK
ncbi:MAG: hypothetical protein PHV37_06020 [Candidatus Gastranaerophilales bacterium]|nr:hypothetical protein [Candidatus Gastranaerophilales bacterium]